MNKRVRRFILQVFSSLNALFLAFQPLAALPVLLANPTVVQAETSVSADAVNLTFDVKNHEFELRVKTDQELPYILTYLDEKQDPQVEQAAQGNLEKMEEGVFGTDVYAGTCSGEVCTPITFLTGSLQVGSSFKTTWTYNNGLITLGSGANDEIVCLEPDAQRLTAGNTLWSVDVTSQTAETKTHVQLGVAYQFPLDENVSVTFTCLPKDESLRSSLKMQQVAVDELALPDSVKTYSKYAYDITTDMSNGTFKYELTLPKAEGQTAAVTYIEKTLDEAKQEVTEDEVKTVELKDEIKIEQQVSGEDVKVEGLDHFTIFVVTFEDPQDPSPSSPGYNDVWFNAGGVITRVPSGTNGITSSGGSYHSEITGPVFTRWGGYSSVFPTLGYKTNVDIYLDMALADGSSDKRFDFSSAINNIDGNHRRDFIISMGTNPSIAGQWLASASNNAPGWPGDPNRNPVSISETGWYTIQHNFKENSSGVLEVTITLTKKNEGSPLGTWSLSDPSDIVGVTVGGNRYGWFTSPRFDFTWLAIDSASIEKPEPVVSTVIIPKDNTSWLFNRDLSTSSPFEFNTDQAKIGTGSLYVKPIGANASDKFIAEEFVRSPIADITAISYDFMIGSGGDSADANQFYMSVYANFGESSPDKYYDCRYSVVPSSGSTTDFTKVTFDPKQAYPVAKSGSSPHDCPAIPAEMDASSPNSIFRMYALNVGDTSSNDVGLDGYLDNVVIDKGTEVTIFDFEPLPLSQPTNLGWNTRSQSTTAEERPIDLVCGSTTNADYPTYNNGQVAHNWETTDTNAGLKFQRQWQWPGSGVWTTDSTAYSVTNTNFATFGSAIGTEGTWNSRVRSWLDQNGNAVFDEGTDLASEWSNECAVTYDRDYQPTSPGSITITKDVVPNDASVWDFTISPPGNIALGYLDMPDGGSHTFSNLVSGSYTISESTSPEYTTSIVCSNNMTASSNQVSFVLAEGEDVTCTYTNTFIGRCGDGQVMGQEQCDYGQLNGQSSCSSQCTWVSECRAEMIPNGSFETPVVTQGAGWDAFGNAEMAGWTATWYGGSDSYDGHDRPESKTELHRGVLGAASKGEQYVELDTDWTGPDEFSGEPASISLFQDIPTVIGNQYTVSWKYSARPNYSGNHLEVKVGDTVAFDSGVVAGGSTIYWQAKTYTFIATTTLTKVSFTELGLADSLGMFLDDVTVSCNGPVPTSSTVTVCKEDSNGAKLPGWSVYLKGESVQADLSVPTNSSTGIDSITLDANTSYLAEARGTWTNQGGANPVDTEYSTTDGWASQMDGYTGYQTDILELQINSSFDPNSNWGTYNSAHRYAQSFSQTATGSANFRVFDGTGTTQNEGWFGDNNGSLTVDISKGYAGITGTDGCVTFDTVPYGSYTLGEVMQDGWEYSDGNRGEVTVSGENTTLSLRNKEIPTKGKIIIEKQTVPDGDRQSFEFNPSWSDVNFNLTDGSQHESGWLDSGTYNISEIALSGWTLSSATCTDQSPVDAISLQPSETVTCTFTNTLLGSISGTKWEDMNGNGTKDTEDESISGWTINLDKDADGTIDDTTTTDASGNYSFGNLLPGNYKVMENTPSPWIVAYPAAGVNFYTGINLSAGAHLTGYDFGNYENVSIKVCKQEDADGNISTTDDRTHVQDWSMTLYDDAAQVGSSYTTGADGCYTWTNLGPGNYSVTEESRSGWQNLNSLSHGFGVLQSGSGEHSWTFVNSQLGKVILKKDMIGGTDSFDFTGDVSGTISTDNGTITVDNVVPGDYTSVESVKAGWDLTNISCDDSDSLVDIPTRSVLFRVVSGESVYCTFTNTRQTAPLFVNKFEDMNGNGIGETGDAALSGWTMEAYDNNTCTGTVVATAVTGNDGIATFSALNVGSTYWINEIIQNGWLNTTGNCREVEVLNTQRDNRVGFGNFKLGSISGMKFEDMNNNEVKDPGDAGLAGWTIYIDTNTNGTLDSGEPSTQTLTDGSYTFSELGPENYTIREVMQSDWGQTAPKAGSFVETMTSGANITEKDFGNFHFGEIQGEKYQDDNKDGTSQPSESLLGGWKINLYDSQWQAISSVETADTTGHYRFGNLGLETYYTCEELKTDWKQTGPLDLTDDQVINNSPNVAKEGSLCWRSVFNQSGQNQAGRQFGNIHQGKVTVNKFHDTNTNGVRDTGEDLMDNWDMIMATIGGSSKMQTTDGGDGTIFTLDPDTYYLTETEQKGWIQSGMYCDERESKPDVTGLPVIVNPGDEITCYVGNYQPGAIEGIKYFDDFDGKQNGTFDKGESVLQYWGMSLSGNGIEEQKVTTDANGGFSFTNLKKGTYTLCEEDRTAWGWQVTEPVEPINKVCREVVIDQSGETEVANFGNFIASRLYILKTNDAWPNDQQIGDEVTYTIRVMAVGGPVYDATVLDVPPKQLTYVPDSYTAESSDGTDLRADGTTGDPNYQSPGSWKLGNLAKDEIITLTYKAKVGNLADPGVYPDMVWATGTSEQSNTTGGETDDLLALSDPDFSASSGGVNFDGSQGHFGEDNFAGTQVAIVADQTPVSEYQVGKTEEKQGAVLGASTELPATGARAWLTLLALISIVAGAGFLIIGKRSRNSGLKAMTGLLLVGFSLWFAKPAQALTSVRMEEPYNNSAEYTQNAITNQTSMKIDFVVLNVESLDVTAQCQQQKNDGVWNNITTNYTVKAGGNSGYCEAKDLENTQYYDFRVVVSGDGPDKISDEVRVGLETTRPDKPTSYSKSQGNYCEDKISFKTANDGQTTSVEVYRSTDSDHFAAKPETRVITIPIGPNQDYTLTTSKPNCNDTYYYVIRAFDVNGNASDLVGDAEIKTVIVESASGTSQTVQLGALPASSSFITGGSTTGETAGGTAEAANNLATPEETTIEPTETQPVETTEGSVLGSTTESFMSLLSRFGLPIGVGLIVLAGLYVIFFGKRNEK